MDNHPFCHYDKIKNTPNAILFVQTFSVDQVSAYASDLSLIPSALRLFDDATLHLKMVG